METPFDNSVIGRTLTALREDAQVTQSALAKAMGTNTTRVCRIENGDAGPSEEEIQGYLQALDTATAKDYRDYLGATWSGFVERPSFPHPNWRTLLLIDQQLARIATYKADSETKAVFVRALDLYATDFLRCAAFLGSLNHHLVFVGIISVGKTSAICSSVGLVITQDGLGFARRMVLEAGGGRITLCEVEVQSGPEYGLIIEPCTDEEVQLLVLDYADQLLALAGPPGTSRDERSKAGSARTTEKFGAADETPWLPEELARAIRGLAGISEAEAASLATAFPIREELAIQILSRMDLLRRRGTVIWRTADDESSGELEWLQKVFKEINNGRRPGFSLPKRITVVVPRKLFDSNQLNIAVIDTKGIDQTSARADVDAHFDDPHAIVLLCTKFGEAPDLATINLIRRAKLLHPDAGENGRLALLVLPRNAEALDMKDEARNDYVETAEAGYAAKLAHVRRALQPLDAENLPVQFLNATLPADVDAFREFVVQRFTALRQHYIARVTDSVSKLGQLIEHRSVEERAFVFAEVMKHLQTWTASHRRLAGPIRPHEGLSREITKTHPRTLWASVRREGDWDNFNYYYQLGYATRQVVAASAGEQIKNLKAVIDNLHENPDYVDACDFLDQIADYAHAAVEQLSRQVQITGQTLYRTPLHSDSAYWQESEDIYGTGSPFREGVAQKTRQWFQAEALSDLHRRLEDEINRGWSELVDGLAKILESPTTSAESEAA